ncbi:MAG: Crp/Fnr family transcriptional regulator [Vicingus serpentipes]|nr:Crp/Fnr family transcriptional regulator [Vicingus serpentipes]
MSECLGNCVGCLKANYSLFKNLNEEELEILNHKRRKYNFSKGDILYKEGEKIRGLICLNEGKVKLVKKGKVEDEFIVSLHKTVDFVGFDDLMFNGKCSSTAIAIEDTSICVIDKEQFFKVIKNNAVLAIEIIANQSEKSILYQDKLINISQSNLVSRLAFAINQLVDFYGFERDNKTLAVQIKRREIAAISNMNTANVIRTLSKFKNEKIIDTEGQKIVVLNPKKLDEIAK